MTAWQFQALSSLMTETEKRLAAVELALVELAAWIDPANVQDAMRSISAGLNVSVSEEEAEVRLHAIELLKDGLQRFQGPAAGVVRGKAH